MEGDENAQKFHAKLNKEYQIIFLAMALNLFMYLWKRCKKERTKNLQNNSLFVIAEHFYKLDDLAHEIIRIN